MIMIQSSFTSFQEQIRAEQEQYRDLIEREQLEERLQQMQRTAIAIIFPQQTQTQGGPETNVASRNQRRRGRGWGRGRGRQGNQS